MKKDFHPNYQNVIFEDTSAGFRVLTKSTLAPTLSETAKWEDGNEYPVLKVEVSSASHPFYTGKQMLVDTANRVGKFEERMAKAAELSKTSGKGKKAKKEEAQAKKEQEEDKKAKAEVAKRTANAAKAKKSNKPEKEEDKKEASK